MKDQHTMGKNGISRKKTIEIWNSMNDLKARLNIARKQITVGSFVWETDTEGNKNKMKEFEVYGGQNQPM